MILAALVLFVCSAELARQAIASSLEPDQRRARAAIVETFGSSSPAAISVAWCESRLHPGAIGGENVGVFQVNYTAHRRTGETWAAFVRRFVDVRRNVAFAFRLSGGGRHWGAWTCQP